MREILFRGKTLDGRWVYGDLWQRPYAKNCVTIVSFMEDTGTTGGLEVIPETVGQYTGLKDKNGRKIYEGDIVREHGNDYTPIYQNGIYMAYNVDKINDPYVSTQFNVIWHNGCEIIGNTHDSPELTEVEDDLH